jgi:hypothetical protein
MHKQPAHQIDRKRAGNTATIYKNRLQNLLDVARKQPANINLYFILTCTQKYLGNLSMSDPTSPLFCRLIKIIVNSSRAIFTEATSGMGPTEIQIDEDLTISIEGVGPTRYAADNHWRVGFYAALISRNDETLDLLAQISTDIMRQAAGFSDECMYLFVEALQAMWKKDAAAVDILLSALDATHYKLRALSYVQNILIPEMQLVYRFLKKDVSGFNDALDYALTRHRIYWGSEDNRVDGYGFIAWGPLALSCLAYDAGFPIEVESDYLPLRLLHGECRA